MQLSVIIPVFNEVSTLQDVLSNVEAVDIDKEVIIVDDFSTDGTRALLSSMSMSSHIIMLHDRNRGKGAALRTAFGRATGEYVIIQDADLEYDPTDYLSLLTEAHQKNADVVYGTRFAAGRPPIALANWIGNRLLTGLTNLLFGTALTDMETCYKLIRRDVLADLTIESDRFNVEPELTAKLLMRGERILEVPISYRARTRSDGKKISWRDFVSAVWTLLRLRLVAR